MRESREMRAQTQKLVLHRLLSIAYPEYQNGMLNLVLLWLIVGICLLILPSCANLGGPAYQRPELPVKKEWSRGTSTAEAIRLDWWTAFGDPYLDSLIEKAIAQSIDLKILAARSEVAEVAIEQARAGALPTVNLGFGVNTQKVTGQSSTTQYNAASALNWELDIWGKFRKGVKAQTAAYKTTEADWRAGYLTLVSNVATSYFQIRQFDEQIQRQQAYLNQNEEILAIYESMHQEGLIPETQILQQKAEISRLNTGLLELHRLRTVTENALATLLGIPAGELQVPRSYLQDSVDIIGVPSGLPADLLSRRPDIIAAEYRILQAHELSGQAKLAKLPSITLTARGGTASFELTDLMKMWTFGIMPSINFPIFDPNINARIKVSKAEAKVAAEKYRRTVFQAFEEVENALTNLASRKEQKRELEQQIVDLKIVSDQIQAQLEEGLISQLQVFEIQRSLLAAELAMLSNYQQILSSTVTLYKALGGGWPKTNIQQSLQ
ncbi:efflux transporter outer membrane subunit [Nitrosococcus wardiae]|uniref:Efflux transporter outer membrane subunit n=2 Tax=Nitrosococcus wardiae TaxID=1814290 RepID=A0A4P7BXC5_9GAMM|nr:efflux transporter outer membrane subunit [Nitrosococcus wardiae]